MSKSIPFTIEKFSDNCIWLRSDSQPEKILYSIQEKELHIGNGKGVIPINNIGKITLTPKDNNRMEIYVHMKENKKWNENQKKKHPILWNLGLLAKSQARTITLGSTTNNEQAEILIDFIKKLGINVE